MESDQPDDVTVEEISDAVARIPLPLPLAELRSVNCYAVRGPDGLTLIDPGWVWTETTTALESGLAGLGLALDDVSRILITHSHWDHYSQAYRWHLERGTDLYLGAGERHSIQAWKDLDGAFPLQVGLLQRAGDGARADLLEHHPVSETERSTDFGDPTTYLDGGETLTGSDVPIGVISTPGHTRGHLVFEDLTHQMLFTGDHVLPRITPSIAYERAPDRLALRSYLSSLQLLLDRPDATMLPAHGLPTSSVHARVTELIAHHDDRLKVVGDLVAQGERTALDVASGMTWTRREKSLAELGDDHSWTAVLEAAAHLELLVWRGDLTKDDSGPVDLYSVA
ncbi:MBL fold metallo-hydrolase [Aeromicrobium alkaliterrae]|uniref:MBL fold metallo-hydrolase n=1 Tax=Aeromicrobium alkaliterrae TaxID=302168 RepID=A0ABN2K878_9ACTN